MQGQSCREILELVVEIKTNAKTIPKLYYGLHICEGVAEYREPEVNNGNPYRILVTENALKGMDQTFSGRPVYVNHVPEVDLDRLQEESDGYVVRSFFNPPDGKHWVEFLVVSDKGHEALSKGWRLSNAYMPKDFAGGGLWHAVEYSKELKQGEYQHLAIVPNPRYEESIVLTPEEFKAYNSRKEFELRALANANPEKKEENSSMLKFFKRSKVENSAELESTAVVLKSGREVLITQLINEADEHDAAAEKSKEESKKPQMANGEHMVKVGDEDMSVNALVQKYQEMREKQKPPAENSDDEKIKKEAEEKLKSQSEADKVAADKERMEKQNANFNAIKNADKGKDDQVLVIRDGIALGKSRYGK